MLANHPLIWEAAALLPAASSQGLCYTLQMLTGQGVTSTSVLGVKSCSPYWPFQAKWPRTPAQQLSPLVLPRQIAFPQPGEADWDNHVPTEPPRPHVILVKPHWQTGGALNVPDSREPWQAAHSQLDLQPSLPSPPLSLWACAFCGTVWTSRSWGVSPAICQAGLAH